MISLATQAADLLSAGSDPIWTESIDATLNKVKQQPSAPPVDKSAWQPGALRSGNADRMLSSGRATPQSATHGRADEDGGSALTAIDWETLLAPASFWDQLQTSHPFNVRPCVP